MPVPVVVRGWVMSTTETGSGSPRWPSTAGPDSPPGAASGGPGGLFDIDDFAMTGGIT
jgi:hypothetical protein